MIDISFIIPCLNEEHNLPQTLKNIIEFTPEQIGYEIIVVDNGSTDETVGVSVEFGCKVVISDSDTVGGVRNKGVKSSNGEILVFLDADIDLTTEWGARISKTISILKKNKKLITGSHCGIPEIRNKYLRDWFKGIENSTASHLGTGHLIVNAKFFNSLNGFSEKLASGEDFDFCYRATEVGGELFEDMSLKVIHRGYPTKLKDFYMREIWHGAGDWVDVQAVLGSKVLLSSIVFTLCIFSSLLVLLINPIASLVLLLMSQILCALIVIYKFGVRDSLVVLLNRIVVANIYLVARVMAFTYSKPVFSKS